MSELSKGWDRTTLEISDKMLSWDPLYHEQVRTLCRALRSCRVVGDLCVGLGYTAKELVNQGKKVYGIDISAEALEYARKTVGVDEADRFLPIQADIYHLPFADVSLDGLLSLSNMGCCSEVERFVIEARRVLKPNGLIAITGQEPEQSRLYQEYLRRELGRLPPIELTPEQVGKLAQMRRGFSSELEDGKGTKRDTCITRNSSAYISPVLQKHNMELVEYAPICQGMFYLLVARKGSKSN